MNNESIVVKVEILCCQCHFVMDKYNIKEKTYENGVTFCSKCGTLHTHVNESTEVLPKFRWKLYGNKR